MSHNQSPCDENALNRREKRILVDVQEQVEQLLAVVFKNYKSLDEDAPSGLAKSSAPTLGTVAPMLEPAVQIYTLLHDILSVESRNCGAGKGSEGQNSNKIPGQAPTGGIKHNLSKDGSLIEDGRRLPRTNGAPIIQHRYMRTGRNELYYVCVT